MTDTECRHRNQTVDKHVEWMLTCNACGKVHYEVAGRALTIEQLRHERISLGAMSSKLESMFRCGRGGVVAHAENLIKSFDTLHDEVEEAKNKLAEIGVTGETIVDVARSVVEGRPITKSIIDLASSFSMNDPLVHLADVAKKSIDAVLAAADAIRREEQRSRRFARAINNDDTESVMDEARSLL